MPGIPHIKKITAGFIVLLLVPVFFILHGYNENLGLITPEISLRLFLKYSIVTAFIYFISVLLFRDQPKAVLFSFYILSLYFFFGALHDFFKTFFSSGLFTSYKFFLPLLFLLSGLILIFLYKSKKNWNTPLRFWSYFFVIITLLELGRLIINGADDKGINNLGGKEVILSPTLNNCSTLQKPDIFFIVLDGYTSSACLQEEFGFSNEATDSLLRNNQFYIATASRSNYNVTPFSLSATMNLNYLKPGIEKQKEQDKLFLQAIETLKQNTVTKFFNAEGYQIKNFGCFDFADAPASTIPYFADLFYRQIDDQTLSSRIVRDIGWNFTTRNIFTGAFQVPKKYRKAKELHLRRNQFNWEQLREELSRKSDSPRFVYTHLMLPHEPFYLDRDGRLVSDTAIILNSLDLKAAYLEQLRYTNRLLTGMIPLLTLPSERGRVVLLQGDHGFRDYTPGTDKGKEFMNLNAFYFSDHDYSMLDKAISSVNSFRVVLNKYFCQQLPYLKDSSIYFNH